MINLSQSAGIGVSQARTRADALLLLRLTQLRETFPACGLASLNLRADPEYGRIRAGQSQREDLSAGKTRVKRGLLSLCLDRSRGSGQLRFTPDSRVIRAAG
jgi:hypothetical protein